MGCRKLTYETKKTTLSVVRDQVTREGNIEQSFLSLDPLADAKGQVHNSPYAYTMNNPVYFADPDGNCPPGVDCVGILTALWTAITSDTKATGSAKPAVITNTKTKDGIEGFVAEGKVEGEYGKIEGKISGFGASKEKIKGESSIQAGSEIHGLDANVEARLGTKDNNIAVEGKGSVFKAEANLTAGRLKGENGVSGVALEANAGASALSGEVNPSATIGGLKLGFTIGGSIGSAHIGGGLKATKNKDGGRQLKAQVNAGFGGGVKFGFDFSTTGNSTKRKK